MVVLAINRTASPVTAGIAVTHDRILDYAEVYQLTSASPIPQQTTDIDLTLLNAFQYTMPAYSVSTLVLYSSNLPGDFDDDGDVDGNDFLLWQRGESANGPTSGDLASWQANFGTASISDASAANVPEPGAWTLACVVTLLGPHLLRRRSAW